MQDVERLKQRIPLLDYLRQHHWTAHAAGQEEFVGLCPLHHDHRPSFYVNARKNLFYCHGCGRGGDLIRFVELSQHLSFCQSLALLQRNSPLPGSAQCWSKPLHFTGFNSTVIRKRRNTWKDADCAMLP